MCRAHGQFVPIRRLDDLGGEQRLQLLNIGVLPAQVAKYIAAAVHQLKLAGFHGSAFFNLFKRSLIKMRARPR